MLRGLNLLAGSLLALQGTVGCFSATEDDSNAAQPATVTEQEAADPAVHSGEEDSDLGLPEGLERSLEELRLESEETERQAQVHSSVDAWKARLADVMEGKYHDSEVMAVVLRDVKKASHSPILDGEFLYEVLEGQVVRSANPLPDVIEVLRLDEPSSERATLGPVPTREDLRFFVLLFRRADGQLELVEELGSGIAGVAYSRRDDGDRFDVPHGPLDVTLEELGFFVEASQ